MQRDRVEHWNKGYKSGKQGITAFNPMSRIPQHLDHIRGKKILEIGPGDGRQLNLIKPYSSEYAVADISPRCLHNYIGSNMNRYLIHSFDDDFNDTFDMVVLFFVWHHVLMEETESFMGLLDRHTKPGGHICFNTATYGDVNPTYNNTTARNPDEMRNFLTLRNYQIVYEESYKRGSFRTIDNDYLFLIKKHQ